MDMKPRIAVALPLFPNQIERLRAHGDHHHQ
jgi:hypothetical protein